jgi:hypothetical protein
MGVPCPSAVQAPVCACLCVSGGATARVLSECDKNACMLTFFQAHLTTTITLLCDYMHGHALEDSLATPGNLNYITSLQDGDTALFKAAFGGHKEALQLLLESKADINAVNQVCCGDLSQCMCGRMTIY